MVGDVIILVGFITLVLVILFLLFTMLPHALAPQPLQILYKHQGLTITSIRAPGGIFAAVYASSPNNSTIIVVSYRHVYYFDIYRRSFETVTFIDYKYVKVCCKLTKIEEVYIPIIEKWIRLETVNTYVVVASPSSCQYVTIPERLARVPTRVVVPFMFSNVTLILEDYKCRPVGIPVVFVPYASMVRRGNIFGIVVPK